LGARDTLRLEAALPLYGHEFQPDRPIFSVPQAGWGVSLDDSRSGFPGRAALLKQKQALRDSLDGLVPRRIMAVKALEKCMMRGGSAVMLGDTKVGELTSGTMVPSWRFSEGLPTEEYYRRALGLAYLDRWIGPGQEVRVLYNGKSLPAIVVSAFGKPAGNYYVPLA